MLVVQNALNTVSHGSMGVFDETFQLGGYTPGLSTLLGAVRAVSGLSGVVVSIAQSIFGKITALRTGETFDLKAKIHDLKACSLQIVRGGIEMVPIIGNIFVGVFDFSRWVSHTRTLDKQLDSANTEKCKLNQELTKMQSILSKYKAQLEKDAKLGAETEKDLRNQLRAEQRKSSLSLLTDQIDNSPLSQLKCDLKHVQEKLLESEKKYKEIETKYTDAKKTIELFKQKPSASSYQGALDNLTLEVAEYKKSLERIEEDQLVIGESKSRLEQQVESLTNQVTKSAEDKKELSEKLKELTVQKQQLENEKSELETKFSNLKIKSQQNEDEYNSARLKLEQDLIDLRKKYEEFSRQSVQNVQDSVEKVSTPLFDSMKHSVPLNPTNLENSALAALSDSLEKEIATLKKEKDFANKQLNTKGVIESEKEKITAKYNDFSTSIKEKKKNLELVKEELQNRKKNARKSLQVQIPQNYSGNNAPNSGQSTPIYGSPIDSPKFGSSSSSNSPQSLKKSVSLKNLLQFGSPGKKRDSTEITKIDVPNS